MKVVLTGATGFVGRALVKKLTQYKGVELSVVVRNKPNNFPKSVKIYKIPSIDSSTNWHSILENKNIIIHCAARAHIMKETSSNPLTSFRKINVDGTLNLANQAITAGIRRFIFLSSAKVNGEYSKIGKPFETDHQPSPTDPYSISKFEAELGLTKISSKTDMEVVIVRPVIIYGPEVKANFLSMINWLRKNVPLPLGAIYNSRSLLGIDNLIDFLLVCLTHPKAARQTFFVSDGEDVSTSDLLRRTAQSMNIRALLFPFPSFLLKLAATLIGKRKIAERLCNTLQVDIKKNFYLLGWKPPLTLDQGLKKTIKGIKF